MTNWIAKEILLKYQNSIVSAWLAQVSCFRFCGFLLAIIGWSMCLMSTAGTQWRVWDIERIPGISSERLWIGIWRACFIHDKPVEKLYLHCEEFTEEYRTLPKEIFIAQDLMSLAAILQSLAIGFMAFALWNVFKSEKHKKVLFTSFSIGGILNLISAMITLVPISWNLYSVLMNESIEFPEFFVLPESPKEQYVGSAIYEGYVASGFMLSSGIVILSKKCSRRKKKINPLIMVKLDPPPPSSKSDTQNCPQCNSSMDLSKLIVLDN
ncbi:claudin-34 [Pogona vitticeps]